jgi:hypothetical protein
MYRSEGDTKRTADVHPDEVENWEKKGWRHVVVAAPVPAVVASEPPSEMDSAITVEEAAIRAAKAVPKQKRK